LVDGDRSLFDVVSRSGVARPCRATIRSADIPRRTRDTYLALRSFLERDELQRSVPISERSPPQQDGELKPLS